MALLSLVVALCCCYTTRQSFGTFTFVT